MIVTNITPCIKITKENNMSGMDMYLELGTKIRLIDDDNNNVEGIIVSLELSQYEEQDDILHLVLDNQKHFSVGVSHIVDIEEL